MVYNFLEKFLVKLCVKVDPNLSTKTDFPGSLVFFFMFLDGISPFVLYF